MSKNRSLIKIFIFTVVKFLKIFEIFGFFKNRVFFIAWFFLTYTQELAKTVPISSWLNFNLIKSKFRQNFHQYFLVIFRVFRNFFVFFRKLTAPFFGFFVGFFFEFFWIFDIKLLKIRISLSKIFFVWNLTLLRFVILVLTGIGFTRDASKFTS